MGSLFLSFDVFVLNVAIFGVAIRPFVYYMNISLHDI